MGLLGFSTNLLAELILAEGKPTGQWYNPERNGEGFFIEIFTIGNDEWVSIAMFTYDESGKQMWLTGAAELGSAQTVVKIEVNSFDGPVWGPDYDTDDLNTNAFGQITVSFPTCDTGIFQVLTDVGLANGNYSVIRLTDIKGIECQDPPSLQSPTPGHWRGTAVCFNVAADGLSITGVGSPCDQGNAFDSNLDGINNEGNDCGVEVDCEGKWAIEDGTFNCVSNLGTLAVGTFTSATTIVGLAIEGEGGFNDYCTAVWSASPN
jgi:hypothetical protein